MPDYFATGARAGKAKVTAYQYMLPSGQPSGVMVYPGVITNARGDLLDGGSWPAATASGDGAQAFLNRIWADLDEIASNPEGLRLLETMSRVSPLESEVAGNEFTDPADVVKQSPVKALITHADPGGKTAASALKKQAVGVSLDGSSWTGEGIGNSSNVITIADSVPGTYKADGNLFAMRSATALFHELVHSLRNVLGFTPLTASQTHVLAEYFVAVPGTRDALGTPEYEAFDTAIEELVTHGGEPGLKEAFGTKRKFGPFEFGIKADPYAAKAVRIAAARAEASPGDQVLRQVLTDRQAIAKRPITELSFVKASKISQPHRPNYDSPRKLPLQSFALASGASWDSLTAQDYNDPGKSSRLTKSGATPSACGAGSSADGCGTYSRAATAEERKAAWEFDQAEAAGKVSQEPIEQLVVRELPAEELGVYARAVVEQGLPAFQAGEAGESQPSFTSDLAEAWKTPSTTFTPFGAPSGVEGEAIGSLPRSLNEGWSNLNEALTPAMAMAWLESTARAFTSDSTALDKAATSMALVPVVGQLLGIADSAIHKDPAGVAANVLVLLQVASEFAGQPELAMIFGIGAFLTIAVQGIKDLVSGTDDVTRMIANRDKAWHEVVDEHIKTKTIPALLDAAQKAFDKAQREVLFGGYVTMAMMDKVAASHPDDPEVKKSVEASKATVRKDTAEAMDSLRNGFTDGAHKALDAAVADLNKGTGSADFSREYMKRAERSAFIKGQQSAVCSPLYVASYKACLHRVEGSAGGGFDKDFIPKVVANVPTNKFSADDLANYKKSMDELGKDKFGLLMVTDPATSPVTPGPGESVCEGTPPGPVMCATRRPDPETPDN
ncbi:M91 family zinc metallopeptidase [Streptomyces lydicamycinicus]|uniref:M91 family zinc metallopeptidase n=1 Tax=Streptomyces lydicamycinicus TaxID=1546107 RepID=UPI002034A8C6|nr:M91 family zinc metallopeptidase [Streptomyces lydicamycinicus]USA00530.1 M91 family zinc metallopeptidase [Streptomyces lydicamycinicus]